MLPSGYSVNFEQVGEFQYLIRVKNPDNVNFIAGVGVPGLLMNDEIAAQIWEENKKHFIVELDSMAVKV